MLLSPDAEKSPAKAPGAVVHSGCAYPKNQVRIEGDNKIYARDADSGFKIRFHFAPIAAAPLRRTGGLNVAAGRQHEPIKWGRETE